MKQNNLILPKFLYRYFSIDKHTERIFKHNELFFRNPNKFNDPYDCRPFLTFGKDWNQNEYTKFVTNNYRDKMYRDLNNEEKKSCEQKAINKFKNVSSRDELCIELNNEIKDSLAKSIHEFRILCLSEKYNDILMWSHYAKGHRGFVLQFDTKVLGNFKKPLQIQKVFYPPNKSFPSIKDFNEKNCTNMFLITKSSQWKYEYEWRILMHIKDIDNPEDEGNSYKYENGLITGIIFGCEIRGPKKMEILGWISKYQPQIIPYNAIKDENFFTIKTNPEIM